MPTRYFLHLAYKGTNYHGWQLQKNTALTVQHVLQEKMSLLLHEPIILSGCGRTDTGVHARQFYAHFESKEPTLISDKKQWLFKMNQTVPRDIALIDIIPVLPNATARYSATARTYQYFIHRTPNPFLNDTSVYIYGDIDIPLMNQAAEIIKNTKDFTSFTKVNNSHNTYICHIMQCHWQEEKEQLIFTVKANRFLRNMVRALVGTMLEVGTKKINIEQFKEIVEKQDRAAAGKSAHGKGLHLIEIEYPPTIFEIEN
ncbi:MAG: tRNA pseudouridine(38-40) synthase TruA [Bacteroidetes bacterium]|nr:tRNA pseudouridine(38-40) synthase TruA [Bacteroidota bacterium]